MSDERKPARPLMPFGRWQQTAVTDAESDPDDGMLTLGDCEECDAVNVTLYRVKRQWLCAQCAGVVDDDAYERDAENAARKRDAAEGFDD